MPEFQIRGNWVPADNSTNHFEVAATTTEGILAVRNTYSPQFVLYCTLAQLTAFGTALTSGQMRSLGIHG